MRCSVLDSYFSCHHLALKGLGHEIRIGQDDQILRLNKNIYWFFVVSTRWSSDELLYLQLWWKYIREIIVIEDFFNITVSHSPWYFFKITALRKLYFCGQANHTFQGHATFFSQWINREQGSSTGKLTGNSNNIISPLYFHLNCMGNGKDDSLTKAHLQIQKQVDALI